MLGIGRQYQKVSIPSHWQPQQEGKCQSKDEISATEQSQGLLLKVRYLFRQWRPHGGGEQAIDIKGVFLKVVYQYSLLAWMTYLLLTF